MRLDLRLKFSHATYEHGLLVGVFKEKAPATLFRSDQLYPVAEQIIKNRLTMISQFQEVPLSRFDECEVSEHDLILALAGCRQIRERKLLTYQPQF